jgi:polysaccharide pyruvyl transferase WcaK-like protein
MTTRIVLVGNNTNVNRGCEAIARGTQAILDRVSEGKVSVRSGVIVHTDLALRHANNRKATAGEPAQFALRPTHEGGLLAAALNKLGVRRREFHFQGLQKEVSEAALVLSVGGDNYTLDYGRPYAFLDLDNEIRNIGRPLVIWGASIGPFNQDPDFEKTMLAHLRLHDHIFVRETVSFNYLIQRGLRNVTLMVDPAVWMTPAEPADPGYAADAFKGGIGLNFSPFQARQLAGGGKNYWETTESELAALADFVSGIVSAVLSLDPRPIVLAPHVVAEDAWNNDWMLLNQARMRLRPADAERVALLPPHLGAAELKWCIGQCSIFAGSRTHSTLAAISSGVPTLAFAYSQKSSGLMRDLCGNEDMLLPNQPLNRHVMLDRIRALIAQEAALRRTIADVLPRWKESAVAAGEKVMGLTR